MRFKKIDTSEFNTATNIKYACRSRLKRKKIRLKHFIWKKLTEDEMNLVGEKKEDVEYMYNYCHFKRTLPKNVLVVLSKRLVQ
jgi:hypothetical protein